MKPGEAPRWLWGRRALGLALGGGLVGWIVAHVGLLAFLQGMRGLAAPGGPDESDLMLVALVGGGACGAALGLVIWLAWFLVSRLARGHRSRPSPDFSPYVLNRVAFYVISVCSADVYTTTLMATR